MDNINLEKEDEEEKFVQMVQDFMESESSSSSANCSFFPTSSSSSSYFECSGLKNRRHPQCLLREILGSGDEFLREVEREVMERVEKHMKKMRKERGESGLKKWMAMRLKMDGFAASLCHNSWVSTFACPAGDYEYIDVQVLKDDEGSDQEPLRLILDLDFRSQFELARPTETYKEVTDSLPAIFIGDEAKLKAVVSLLCSAAKKSLKERGLHIPPWRTTTYMQCKWLPQSPTDKTKHAPMRKWIPPTSVKNVKGRGLGSSGSSGLSSQFSNMRINCC